MKPLRSILSHPDISGFTVFQRTVVYALAFLVFMLLPVYFILRKRIKCVWYEQKRNGGTVITA